MRTVSPEPMLFAHVSGRAKKARFETLLRERTRACTENLKDLFCHDTDYWFDISSRIDFCSLKTRQLARHDFFFFFSNSPGVVCLVF